MIHHFPNFVCWEEVFKQYKSSRDILYIDAFSCYLVGLMLAVRGSYFSGPQMAHRLDQVGLDKCFFLLADKISSIPSDKQLVLKFKDSFKGDEEVLSFLKKTPKSASLILGISSPKQNSLAVYLHSIRPDLEYFCLGAAVKQTWDFKHANTKLRGTGFQWLEFFFLQPRRTGGKLLKTAIEPLKLILSKKKLQLFRRFIISTKREISSQ